MAEDCSRGAASFYVSMDDGTGPICDETHGVGHTSLNGCSLAAGNGGGKRGSAQPYEAPTQTTFLQPLFLHLDFAKAWTLRQVARGETFIEQLRCTTSTAVHRNSRGSVWRKPRRTIITDWYSISALKASYTTEVSDSSTRLRITSAKGRVWTTSIEELAVCKEVMIIRRAYVKAILFRVRSTNDTQIGFLGGLTSRLCQVNRVS
jgi:hypothetical protein